MSPRQTPRPRRSLKLLAWPAVPVVALVVWVQATGTGLDILLVLAACFLLLAAERTVGDWLGELLGPWPASLVFALLAAGLAWYLFASATGKSQTEQFFATAEKRGYRTAYYSPTPKAVDRSEGSAPSPAAHGSSDAGGKSPDRSGPSGGGAESQPAGRTDGTSPPDDSRPPAEPSRAKPAAGQQTGSDAVPATAPRSRWRNLVFGRTAAEPSHLATTISLTVSPGQVVAARQTTLRAAVAAAGRPVAEGSVEFTVNGVGAGVVRVGSDGTARTTFSTHIVGTHQIRARFSGTVRYSASASGEQTLKVAPGAFD